MFNLCVVVVTAGEFGKCAGEIDYSDMCDCDSSESLEKKDAQVLPQPYHFFLYYCIWNKSWTTDKLFDFMIATGRIKDVLLYLPTTEL